MGLKQAPQTSGSRGHFVRPAMLSGNFQIIKIRFSSFTGV